MAIDAPFSSASEAEQAYYGSESGSGDGSGAGGGSGDGTNDGPTNTSGSWGDLQQSAALGSGWVLAYQAAVNSDRRRWFVIRSSGGDLQALRSNGQVYTAKESDSLGELPHYDTEGDARDAFEAWAADNGGENAEEPTPDGEDTEWGEWQKVRKVGSWFIFGRTSADEERAQFVIAGQREDETVYLHPEGEIAAEPHIYESINAAQSALEAYSQGVESGDIPPGMQPNGNAPTSSTVREAVSEVVRQSSSQSQSRVVERLGGKRALLAAIGVAGLAVITQRGEE